MRRTYVRLIAISILIAPIGVALFSFPAGAVGPAASVTLTSSVNPAAAGQAVTVKAKVVDPTTPAAGITGSMAFLDGPTTLATVPVSSGVASFSTRALGTGTHVLTAAFTDATASSVVSAPLTETVAMAATTTTAVSTLPTANYGQNGNINASVKAVAPGAGVPTGSVDFYIDGGWYWTAFLDANGKAQLPLSAIYPSYYPGTYAITAIYSGDANYATSTTATGVAQTLVGISTTPVTMLGLNATGQLNFTPNSFTLSSANPVGCNVTITNTTPGAIALTYGTPGSWKRLPGGVIAAGTSKGVGVGLSNFTGYFSAMGTANYVRIRCL